MALTDAINSYRLFLGRDPETEQVAEQRSTIPLRNSLAGFIASGEFSDNVLGALFDRGALPHVNVSPYPADDMKEWAAAALPITDATRPKVLQAKSWRGVLMYVLLDPDFFEQIGNFADNKVYRQFREKFAGAEFFDLDREIVGAINDVSTLEIRGWAANLVDLSQPVQVELLLDNLFLGVAECSQFRPDIQGKLGGPGLHGFSFIIPAAHQHELRTERLLTVRDTLSRLPIARPIRIDISEARVLNTLIEVRHELATLTTELKRIEGLLPVALSRAAYPLTMYDDYQRETQRLLANNRANLAAAAAALSSHPMISVVIAGPANGTLALSRSVGSVRRQIYENWECLVYDEGSDDDAERKSLIDGFAASDSRVRRAKAPARATQAALLNLMVAAAKGTHVMFLHEGDVLSEDALLVIGQALQEAQFRLAYFDEDVMELDSFRNRTFRDPMLKPAFDYDFLLASGYIGRAFVFDKVLFDEAGGARGEREGTLCFDLIFRMIEKIDRGRIRHIARVLYHKVEAADAAIEQDRDDAEAAAEIACLTAHLERMGYSGEVAAHSDAQGIARPRCRRISWKLRESAPRVSIIIPTRDRADLLQQCLNSVLASQAEYPTKFEIIVMDNESVEPATHDLLKRFAERDAIRVVPFKGSFNWSAINNAAARQARGEVLVFLNNDTVVLSSDWVRELVSTLSRPDVGVVGARLLYEDGTIQHGGVLMGAASGAVHEGIGESPVEGGYLGRTALQRNVMAVTGACLATRASTFREFGGFDEANLRIEFSDVDYCLKVHDRGLAVIYNPFATLYHFESKSRGFATTSEQSRRSRSEFTVFAKRWRKYLEADPYYNPHFDRFSRPFSRLRPVALLDGRTTSGDENDEPWAGH